MTEDLKTRFAQLVADPPPPSGVPSEAVFARVRTVRRRRTALAGGLAVAAIVGVSLAAGHLTDVGGAPPVTNTPGAPKSVVTGPPPKPKPPIRVVLEPKVQGRTLTMWVTVSGKAYAPRVVPEGTVVGPETSFLNLSAGSDYSFGDNSMNGGSDGGGVECARTTLRSGKERYALEPHTFAKPGTYKFSYFVQYCGTKGWFSTGAGTHVTIR